MKKLLTAILAAGIAFSCLSAKEKLKVLYVGGTPNFETVMKQNVDPAVLEASVKERMANYTKFLKQNFTTVKSIEGKDYTPAMSNDYDVTVFDGMPAAIEPRDDAKRIFHGRYLPMDFDRASVMIGSMSEELGRRIGTKNDWYCLCLQNYALGMNKEHEVFKGPFKVDMSKAGLQPTAQSALDVAEMMGEPLAAQVEMLKMSSNEGNQSGRIGMVSRPGGYLDSPDTEVISGGLSAKSIDAVAIGRHGNFLHFGFADDPAKLTPEGKAILLNSIVYASKFNGKPMIARKFDEGIATRDHLAMNKYVYTRKAWENNNKTNLQFWQTTDSIKKAAKAKQAKGEKLSDGEAFYLTFPDQPKPEPVSYTDYMKKRGGALYEIFGTDEQSYINYYDKNAPYFRAEGYNLVIDKEARALGIANNDIRILDKAIELMEQGKPEGKILLERYTLKRFATPAEWRNWLNENRDKLFFTEAGGYLWLVNEPGANDYTVLTAAPKAAAPAAPKAKLETNKETPVALAAEIETASDGSKWFVLTMKVEPGYHTYATVDPEDPYIKTEITMEYPEGIEPDGKMILPAMTPTSNGTSYYQDTVQFRQKVKGNGHGEIAAKIRYQACDHSECKRPMNETYKATI